MLSSDVSEATPHRRVYSVQEAAAELSVSRSHLYAMREAGLIKFSKLLNRTVITAAELDRVVAKLEAERGAA